jgi:hypothetical protein
MLRRGDVFSVTCRMRRAPLLTGTVTGPDGPVAGAHVYVQNWWDGPHVGHIARTAADGTYLVACAPGRYAVWFAAAGGMQPSGALLPWSRPRDGETFPNLVTVPAAGEVRADFALALIESSSVEVRGRVVDAAGEPLERAMVKSGARTDADGAFRTRAKPGETMRAWKAGYVTATSEPVEAGRDLRIVMARAPRLRGCVTPADGAAVYVVAKPDGSKGIHPELWYHDLRGAGVRTALGPDGVYERALQPGTYLVLAEAFGCAPSAFVEVTLDRDDHVLDFTLDAGVALDGCVVDARTGEPVAGAEIRGVRHEAPFGRLERFDQPFTGEGVPVGDGHAPAVERQPGRVGEP